MVGGMDGGSQGSWFDPQSSSTTEKISVTSLDKFVEDNHLTIIDFIKADIEGVERDMLKGATNVLQKFEPKLAICTYHLKDDPEVLENIIKTANPNYTVVHLKRKLFAMVVK
jgi:L-asparaginase/Glu-tRNA(Gln) amidotransferase subunit D